ncbi:MAG: hypothetical protein WBA73_17185, partial [Devosia sp.]
MSDADHSMPETVARVDMGAVLGTPVSATVGAVGESVVADGPFGAGVPVGAGTAGSTGVPNSQGVEPIVVGDDPSGDAGFREYVRQILLDESWPRVHPEAPRPPVVVNDSAAIAAAVRELLAAKETLMVGRPQQVLDPLVDLDDLDCWIRASEMKKRALRMDDVAMARSRILR